MYLAQDHQLPDIGLLGQQWISQLERFNYSHLGDDEKGLNAFSHMESAALNVDSTVISLK